MNTKIGAFINARNLSYHIKKNQWEDVDRPLIWLIRDDVLWYKLGAYTNIAFRATYGLPTDVIESVVLDNPTIVHDRPSREVGILATLDINTVNKRRWCKYNTGLSKSDLNEYWKMLDTAIADVVASHVNASQRWSSNDVLETRLVLVHRVQRYQEVMDKALNRLHDDIARTIQMLEGLEIIPYKIRRPVDMSRECGASYSFAPLPEHLRPAAHVTTVCVV